MSKKSRPITVTSTPANEHSSAKNMTLHTPLLINGYTRSSQNASRRFLSRRRLLGWRLPTLNPPYRIARGNYKRLADIRTLTRCLPPFRFEVLWFSFSPVTLEESDFVSTDVGNHARRWRMLAWIKRPGVEVLAGPLEDLGGGFDDR
ncbi:MAG: hypothetical protein JO217_01610, partial [Acidobacteriaceae bacterium]|nr:hypothetical protein [Acidobacteriaceae bacterium]